MKIYHTETQEDYDALMVELEGEGYSQVDYFKDSYYLCEGDTYIVIDDASLMPLRLNYGAYVKKRYKDIPIFKYKTNNVGNTANDLVNNPKHYTQGELEVIDILEDKLTPQEFEGFLKGNILKYTFREGIKNGTEDVKKAAWYTARLIKFRKGEN